MASVALTPDADWASFAAPNAEFEELLPSLKGFTLAGPDTTVESLRAMSGKRPKTEQWPGVDEKDISITVRDGHISKARVYSPSESATAGKPLLVMLYGGGWVLGSLEQQEENCRNWVKRHGGVGISVEHRLCPDVKFPVPVEDTFDALKWIAANHESLGADPSKGFVAGGMSSGATTMMAISHLWRDEGITPPLTGLYLSIPGVSLMSAVPEKYKSQIISWEQNKDAPVFNRHSTEFLYRVVNPDPLDPMRSPLLFPSHKDLPPAYFVIGGTDPFRDLGLLYEKILREENGVKTKADVFPGLPHGFWTVFPQSQFAKEQREKSEEGFAWLLEQSK